MAESIDVDIDALNPAGDGVAHHRRRALVVPFTIPGERVRVNPGAPRGGVIVGAIDAILTPSPHRVTPYCPHFGPDAEPGVGACGGCTWQHIAYAEQLRLKSALVTRLVRETVRHAPEARATLPGAPLDYPWGYRHKVHFVFGTAGRAGRRASTLVMGHYVRGSRRIIPVRECPVHDERGNVLAFRLRDAYAAAHVQADTQPGIPSALKSLAVRVGHASDELMATLVLTGDADKRLRTATRRVLDTPDAPSSFHVNLHPKRDAYIFGAETRKISGPDRMREEVAGTSFLISPTAFFQTNVAAADLLVRLVLDAVPESGRILDLYAGAGLFALPLARRGHDIVAVEENRQAVADGEASRRLNRIDERRCTFVARRVEQALGLPVARPPFDVVVLDPPREGCSAEVIERVFGGLAPAIAVYISCNPEALARDLGVITRHGFRVESLQPLDMFPHTAHVETVAVLSRTYLRRT